MAREGASRRPMERQKRAIDPCCIARIGTSFLAWNCFESGPMGHTQVGGFALGNANSQRASVTFWNPSVARATAGSIAEKLDVYP